MILLVCEIARCIGSAKNLEIAELAPTAYSKPRKIPSIRGARPYAKAVSRKSGATRS